MFRLAQEIVAGGGRVITTTTTRIFAAQIALAPRYLPLAEVNPQTLATALAQTSHVLITGEVDQESGKAFGVPVEAIRYLRQMALVSAILIEADGSRMRPFKAPAAHEPVLPPECSQVVAVTGADIFGKPLTAHYVHRPEVVAELCHIAEGTIITPGIVADILAHPQGGLKDIPIGARRTVLINKLDLLKDWQAAESAAALLCDHSAIERVVLGSVQSAQWRVRMGQSIGFDIDDDLTSRDGVRASCFGAIHRPRNDQQTNDKQCAQAQGKKLQ
jgi:molybdenum cofactor cytidylyltransferase